MPICRGPNKSLNLTVILGTDIESSGDRVQRDFEFDFELLNRVCAPETTGGYSLRLEFIHVFNLVTSQISRPERQFGVQRILPTFRQN